MVDVTIIIPTRDREMALQHAIWSCHRAARSLDYEIIVVDDGSKDGTKPRLREPEPRIRPFFLETTRGPSAARNVGLAQAAGSYVKFVDSDDSLEEGALEHEFSAARETEADILLATWTAVRTQGGATVATVTHSPHPLGDPVSDVFSEKAGHIGSFLFRRDYLRGIWWDERLWLLEDWDFYFRAVLRGGKRVMLNESVYRYIIHEGPRLTNPDRLMEYARSHFILVQNLQRTMEEMGLTWEGGRLLAQAYYKNLRIAWRFDPHLARKVLKRIYELDPGFLPRRHEPSSLIRGLARILPLELLLPVYAQARNAAARLGI